MRKITVCFFAVLTALAGNLAATERQQDGVRTTAAKVDHGSPLSGAEIAARLGLEQSVLVSTWNAGFPGTLKWDPKNIVDDGTGTVGLRLAMLPDGSARPYLGGEFQTPDYSTVWGRVAWQASLPEGISGSVAAMFLYKNPYDVATDREFDLEYILGDPKVAHEGGSMQMTLHMKRHDGTGPKEKQSYRIQVPAQCLKSLCGWAIEFQPESVVFEINLNRGEGWETIGRYSHSDGWDISAAAQYFGSVNGKTHRFSNDEVWSEQAVTAFVSYWYTDDQPGWLGVLDESAFEDDVPLFVIESMSLSSYASLSRFRPSDWSLADGGKIVIANMPEDDLYLTDVQYRIDGHDWLDLGASTAGTYTFDRKPRAGATVEIRSIARGPAFAKSGYQIMSAASDAKVSP